MGISVDLWCYSYQELRATYMEMGVDDPDRLDRILKLCGVPLPESDIYVLLNNEHCDNESPYYALMQLIEEAWPAMADAEYEGWKGAQGPLIELRDQFHPGYVGIRSAREKLGLEPEDR